MGIKVVNRSCNKSISNLEVGDVFIILNNDDAMFQGIFMKVKDPKEERNAVRLEDGELFYIQEFHNLQIVHADLLV